MLLRRAYTRREFEDLLLGTKFLSAEIQENLIGLDVMLSKDPRGVILAAGNA
jgi:hypothetical protein